MVRNVIEYNEYTSDELLKMKKSEAIEGLNESQQRFCEAFVGSYNIKSALLKAGYDGNTSQGTSLLKKPRIKRYIQWLKVRILSNSFVAGADVIHQWIKIAFADMTDFVDIKPHGIVLKPSSQVDGQLIKSIKSGPQGVSIELYDKLKALDSLAKYIQDMPKDYKQIIEERKADLMQNEFELKKKMYDLDSKENEDDGFLEALSKTAESVWEDYEEGKNNT